MPRIRNCTVVGLGASAGGIRALEQFFAAVAPDCGLAYIVILHTSPQQEGRLAEVLQRTAPIPVTRVGSRARVDPDHVYVVAPDAILSIVDGHIELGPMNRMEEPCAPVDLFFRTLAEAQHVRAVSVILSGTGANGSTGMKRIKELGGVCIAQEPSDADAADMPRNAIATGLVDCVLRAAEMPGRLAAYHRRLNAGQPTRRGEADEHEREVLDIFNEELGAVNQELEIGIDSLSEASNDARNLMNSTDLAIVFIDRDLRIQLFTPRAASIFNLLPGDSGRRLMDVPHRLDYPGLVSDIECVLAGASVEEREICSTDGRWYIARILPYRTSQERIAAVVLTFTEITKRKCAEEALRASEERLRLVLESTTDYAIFTLDPEGRIESWNSGARDLFGYSEQDAIGKHTGFLFTPEDRASDEAEKEMQRARATGRANDERWHVSKGGRRIFVSGVMAPLAIGGHLVGYTKIARDMTQRANYEEELRAAREQLEASVAERTQKLAEANAALRRQIDERAQAEETRLRLLRQVVRAQEDERRRVSRELHDQLGQDVAALALRIAVLKASTGVTPALRAQIEILEEIVKQLDNDLDFLVWELRPPGLDDLGLAEALSDYAASWSKYFGLPVALQSRLGARLPSEMETVLYRIAQEALNNVAKHAKATEVQMVLEHEADSIALTVQDNGVGFDTSGPLDSHALGLLGMRERAGLVAGTVTIISGPGGTTVRVLVPARIAEEARGNTR